MKPDQKYTLEEFFKEGRAAEKGITEEDVDQEQLKMGVEVEHEHTKDSLVAKKIALDHLAEIPDYYDRLKKMEDEAKAAGSETGKGGDLSAEELVNQMLNVPDDEEI